MGTMEDGIHHQHRIDRRARKTKCKDYLDAHSVSKDVTPTKFPGCRIILLKARSLSRTVAEAENNLDNPRVLWKKYADSGKPAHVRHARNIRPTGKQTTTDAHTSVQCLHPNQTRTL